MIKIILLILFVILFIIVIVQKEPVEISFNIKNCFSGNICWIGQTIILGINFNTEDNKLKGIERPIFIRSIDNSIKQENISIGNESEIRIPMGVAFNEGDYKISVSSELVDTDNVFLLLKRLINSLFREKQYEAIQNINLKYPIVKVQDVGYKCLDKGFYFEEIKLKLDDSYKNELNCKLRIYTDKFVTTNHNLLVKKEINDLSNYYENNYSRINKQDLTGSVQKITFFAGPAVQQTNTKIVPVCLIDKNSVEIKNQEIIKKRCDIN